jgi:uncharacterized protein (DUF2344 family)
LVPRSIRRAGITVSYFDGPQWTEKNLSNPIALNDAA